MKIVVFGASGGTGKLVVEQALAQGHTVTAFVRSPEKLTLEHPRLKVVKGDILDAAAVASATAGHEAVVSSVNSMKPEELPVFEMGAVNIITGMQAAGVRLLSFISSFGAPDGYERDPYYEVNFRQGSLKAAYTEVRKAEAAVMASGLDWILVRPPMLLDTPPTGQYRIETVPPLDMRTLSRADLAAFVLRTLSDPAYIHTGMFVGY